MVNGRSCSIASVTSLKGDDRLILLEIGRGGVMAVLSLPSELPFWDGSSDPPSAWLPQSEFSSYLSSFSQITGATTADQLKESHSLDCIIWGT